MVTVYRTMRFFRRSNGKPSHRGGRVTSVVKMFLSVPARTAPSPAIPPLRASLLAATAAGPRRCLLLPTAARNPRRIQPQPARSFPQRTEPLYHPARRLRPRCHLSAAWFAPLLHPLHSDPSAGAFAPCFPLGI